MHLMYYLDANGKRVYTLKVCSFSLLLERHFFCVLAGNWLGWWLELVRGRTVLSRLLGTSHNAILVELEGGFKEVANR